MQVILLERVENLGSLGDQVTVKDGFARNYLLPQGKALRATSDNVAYFEKERKAIEATNAKKRDEAAKDAKKLEGLMVDLIRQASEAGQLYGSVAGRDIADAICAASDVTVRRSQVDLNSNLKTLGLFDVSVVLHPEVKVTVAVNIARTADEAAIQRKTGKAVVSGAEDKGIVTAEEPQTDTVADDETQAA